MLLLLLISLISRLPEFSDEHSLSHCGHHSHLHVRTGWRPACTKRTEHRNGYDDLAAAGRVAGTGNHGARNNDGA
jgi:hypothetical protein